MNKNPQTPPYTACVEHGRAMPRGPIFHSVCGMGTYRLMTTCKHVFSRGQKANQPCPGKVKEGASYCSTHSYKEPNNNGCKKPISRDERQGMPCGKKCVDDTEFCRAHVPADVEKGCQYELKKGDRAGKSCGKKCMNGIDYCSTHKYLAPGAKTCKWILVRGERVGQECGKSPKVGDKYCCVHAKKMEVC